MKAHAIPRITFSDVLDDERIQLAKDAASKLGYSKLARAISVPASLFFALRELEIEPLVTSSVKQYKARKARPGMWSGHREGIYWMIATGLMCWQVLPRAFAKTLWSGTDPTVWNFVFIIGAMLSVVTFFRGIFMLFHSDARGHRTTYEWKRMQLASYAGNIPEHILMKAVQIKDKLPAVTFEVEQLYEDVEYSPVPQRDPFLIATLVDNNYRETCYIDVWDEKEYETKL